MVEKYDEDSYEPMAGGMTPKEQNQMLQYIAMTKPLIPPQYSMPIGAVLGLYQHGEAQKQRNKDLEWNAKLAPLSRWDPRIQVQTQHDSPNIVGSVLSGMDMTQGLAKSVNQYSPAFNAWNKMELDDEKAREAKANADYEASLGTPEMWYNPELEYDPTLAPEYHAYMSRPDNQPPEPGVYIPGYGGGRTPSPEEQMVGPRYRNMPRDDYPVQSAAGMYKTR